MATPRQALSILDAQSEREAYDHLIGYQGIITRNMANILNTGRHTTVNPEEEIIRKRGRKITPKVSKKFATRIEPSMKKIGGANGKTSMMMGMGEISQTHLRRSPRKSPTMSKQIVQFDVQKGSLSLTASCSSSSNSQSVVSQSQAQSRSQSNSQHSPPQCQEMSIINSQSSTSTSSLSHDYYLRTPTKSPRKQSNNSYKCSPNESSNGNSIQTILFSSTQRTPSKNKSPGKLVFNSQTQTPTRKVSPRKRLVMNSNDSGIEMTPQSLYHEMTPCKVNASNTTSISGIKTKYTCIARIKNSSSTSSSDMNRNAISRSTGLYRLRSSSGSSCSGSSRSAGLKRGRN